jgi:transcriptional regulator with XRE-family HTH domain
MNTRLQQFLAAENISQAQLADSLKVARAGISHIMAGRNKPSYDFLAALMNRYPRLNIEWLMFGKGKMYKDLMETSEIATDLFDEDLFSSQISKEDKQVMENIEPSIEIKSLESKVQETVKQRNVKKIIILFDDNTYQEL